MVKERAKIAKTEKVRLVVFPRKRSLLEQLLNQSQSGSSEARMAKKVVAEFTGGLPMELWQTGGMMKLMPYRISVR